MSPKRLNCFIIYFTAVWLEVSKSSLSAMGTSNIAHGVISADCRLALQALISVPRGALDVIQCWPNSPSIEVRPKITRGHSTYRTHDTLTRTTSSQSSMFNVDQADTVNPRFKNIHDIRTLRPGTVPLSLQSSSI